MPSVIRSQPSLLQPILSYKYNYFLQNWLLKYPLAFMYYYPSLQLCAASLCVCCLWSHCSLQYLHPVDTLACLPIAHWLGLWTKIDKHHKVAAWYAALVVIQVQDKRRYSSIKLHVTSKCIQKQSKIFLQSDTFRRRNKIRISN